MFSGIVAKMGTIAQYDLAEKWGRIGLKFEDWEKPVEQGESIAIQGICLTVAERDKDTLYFDVLRETFEKTNLGEKQAGRKLNMERSLRYGDEMGGHIVVGHVDDIGRVRKIEQVGRDWKFTFSCGQDILDGMVYKGSISVDGVSLTVADLLEDGFTVHIIPFTYRETTFCEYEEGTAVNLEVDLLAKYVRRLLERGATDLDVTWEKLKAEGLS